MNDQEIMQKLQMLLQNVLGCSDITLTAKTKFQDLGIDSFGAVQLICAIEDEFDIEIPNEAIKSINSVPSAVRYIKKKCKTRT